MLLFFNMSFLGLVFFLLIFLFNGLSAISQQPDFAFKNITINDGLSQNSVVDIAEDTSGFMWFATQDGLNRYDGRNFLIFPKAFEDITTPENAQLGKITAFGHELWMVSKGGQIEVFDLYTQKFSPVRKLGKAEEPLPPVSDVHVDEKRNLWIGTLHDGLFYLNREKNELNRYGAGPEAPFAIISNQIRSIFEDSQENIWVLTDQGVSRISGNASVAYLKTINTNVLTEGVDQTLWLGTFGKGIFFKKKHSENFEPFLGFEQSSLPADLVVETIYADKEGKVWVGTYGSGLFIINTTDSTTSHLLPDKRNPFALGFQDVLSIKEDRKGGIWIGTDGGGISYYNKQFNNFSRITTQNVGENISIEQIRAVTTDEEGVVWLGTSGQGLTSFDPSRTKFETFHLKPFNPGVSNYDRVVSLLADEEGDLWIGTQGNGLLVMDRDTKEIIKWFSTESQSDLERIPDNTIWCMLAGKKNQVWVATRHEGLMLMDKEKGMLKKFALAEKKGGRVEDSNVRAVIQVNDSILALGFEKRGIQLLNIRTGNFTPLTNAVIEKVANSGTAIKCLFYQDGWLWAGTAGKGILVTHLKTGRTQKFNDKEGLPNNMIYSLLPEGDSVLWASSNKGIFKLSYTESLQKISVKQIVPYTVADGLQSNEFNTGAFHKSKDGTLYFGGISGLNYFHPERMVYARDALSVVLTEARVGNRPLESDTLITYKKQLDLPYSQNSLSFNYTVLDFVSPEKLHYKYKLEGYDKTWVEAGSRKYTAYTNLPPGNYNFKVKIADNTTAATPLTSLAISIAAPFWLQWWFILLIVVAGAAILYSFYRYRINQYLQVQKVKNTISADLHDDIGSRLTNIQFLSAISKSKLKEGTETNVYLKGIDEEVQASAEALDEIVWNIKITDESLEDIVARMRRYASEAMENDNICYTVKIDAQFARKKMSMQKRRELFLVFKELLNNIRKHAQAGKVDIHISIKDKMFYLAVKDDGIGFDPLELTDRNGIRNIKERVERWHGSLLIQSEVKEGTFVELCIPFDRKSI